MRSWEYSNWHGKWTKNRITSQSLLLLLLLTLQGDASFRNETRYYFCTNIGDYTYFNDMATLMFNTQEVAVKQLFHQTGKRATVPSPDTLYAFGLVTSLVTWQVLLHWLLSGLSFSLTSSLLAGRTELGFPAVSLSPASWLVQPTDDLWPQCLGKYYYFAELCVSLSIIILQVSLLLATRYLWFSG